MKKLLEKYGTESDKRELLPPSIEYHDTELLPPSLEYQETELLPPSLEGGEEIEFPKPSKVPVFEDFDPETINDISEYKYHIYKEKPKNKEHYKSTVPVPRKRATLNSTQLLRLCSRYLDEALK
jgi:hypothetical protein